MTRYDRSQIALAVALSLLAGFVDGVGFLHLGGLFVSFMSGNSTRMAVSLSGQAGQALVCAAIIATFVTGVVAGSLLGHVAKQRRRVAVLGCETFFLLSGALLQGRGYPTPAVGCMILAMGIENTVFQRDGEVSVGLTYMTGTLVKMGQRIAAAFVGGSPLGWVRYFVLWAGLVTGGIVGAICYRAIGLSALWLAATYSAAIFVVVFVEKSRLQEPA